MIFPMNFFVNLQCSDQISFGSLHTPRIALCVAKVQQGGGYNFSQETGDKAVEPSYTPYKLTSKLSN